MRMSLKYRPICRVRYVSYWMPSGCHISAILWERGLRCPCLVPHSPPCSYPKHTVRCDLRVLFTNDSEKMKHSWICFLGSLFHGWIAMRVRVNVIWCGLVLQCSVLSALQITRNPFNDLIMMVIRRALFLLIYSYCFLHPLVRYLSTLSLRRACRE